MKQPEAKNMLYLHPIKLVVHDLPPESALGVFVYQWNTWLQLIGLALLLHNFQFGLLVLGPAREEGAELEVVLHRFLPWFLRLLIVIIHRVLIFL